jgi:hypothetical protein
MCCLVRQVVHGGLTGGLHSLHVLNRLLPKENMLFSPAVKTVGFLHSSSSRRKRNLGDILHEAAVKYGKLLNVGYHIILGRKNIQYEINLRFEKEDFFHLAGLQHLKDITFPSQNRERIYKDICLKKVSMEVIQNSNFYEQCNIRERISNLYRLEEMLDSNKLLFCINHREYMKYTRIVADYLCEYDDGTDVFYFFIVQHKKIKFEYRGCSFFKKNKTNFRVGTAEAKILLNEKIIGLGTENEATIELYRNPNYKI